MGHVYRGHTIQDLDGHYFFGDHCRGWIRSLRPDGDIVDVHEWSHSNIGAILSFGEDSDGELYVLSKPGRVYRIQQR